MTIPEIIGGNISTHTVNISHDLVAKDAKFGSIDCDADELPVAKRMKFNDPLQNAVMDHLNSYGYTDIYCSAQFTDSDGGITTFSDAIKIKFNFNRINEGSVLVTGPIITYTDTSYFTKVNGLTFMRFFPKTVVSNAGNTVSKYFPDMIDTTYYLKFTIPFEIRVSPKTGATEYYNGTITYKKNEINMNIEDDIFQCTSDTNNVTNLAITPTSVVVPLASPESRELFNTRYLN